MAEMKDSGIHAIGRIPKEWNVVRTKYLSNISIGLVTTMTENYVEKEEGVPLIRNGNIRCNKIDVNGMVFLDKRFAEKNKHRQLHTGQIATVHTGDVGTSIVIPEEYDGGLGFATIQSTPYKGVSSEFLCWFYNSAAFKNQCIECSTGDGRQNLNLYDFVDLFVAIPKYDLQSKIASFLDKKCAEIDSLHTDIEKQIETLEEYKKSIITEAVTKGLDPDVEMKDSGIGLIGLIPKTWKIIKTKYVSNISIGLVTTMTTNYVDNPCDGVPLIRNGDIRTNKIKPNGMVYLSKKFVEQNSNRKLQEKDIVTVHTGYVGTSAVIKDEFIGSVGFATIQSRPNLDMVNERYLCWFYNSNSFIEQCLLHNTGDGRQNLNLYDFVNLWIALPDLKEQETIADYLDLKCEEINMVIQEVNKQLETIEQYKKSLIYEYVTGKKEVPDYE